MGLKLDKLRFICPLKICNIYLYSPYSCLVIVNYYYYTGIVALYLNIYI